MKKWLLLVLAIVSAIGVYGANDDLRFRHFSTENGMSSDCVRDIIQDQQGYMWFATDGGVIRYDGYEFVNYVLRCNDGDVDALHFPLSLCQNDGTIWVGSDKHLYRYNPMHDDFESVKIGIERNEKNLDIRHITADKDGALWLSAMEVGLVRISEKDGMDTKIFPLPQANNNLSALIVDSRNEVWATSATRNGGLYKLDKRDGNFKQVPLTLQGNTLSLRPTAMAEDDNGMIWLGNQQGELYMLNTFGNALTRYLPRTKQGVKLDRIHTIRPLADGGLMIGSDSGLGVYDPRRGSLRLYSYDDTDPYSLSGQFVYPIAIDREGGTWIGTFYGGVNYLAPDLKRFVTYQPSHFRNSVHGSVISAFVEGPDGRIYIGSDDGGVSIYNPTNETFDYISLQPGGLESGSIDNVHALGIKGNDLWVGTYGDGIYRYNLVTRSSKNYNAGETNLGKQLPSVNCYAIDVDQKGNLWAGSDQFLVRYDAVDDAFVTIRDLDTQIIDIDHDSKGNLWIATQGNGVYHYDPVNDSWKNYRSSHNRGSLAHDHANCIEIDSSKNVWIATYGGLSRYNPETDSFETLGISYNCGSMMSLVEDQGTIWVTTQHGLVKYMPDGSIDVYTMSDGLTSSQFMPESILKASNGRIYVGSRCGFNAFYPYQVQGNQQKPPIVFTGLEIANKRVSVGDEHLPVEINQIDKIILHPDDRHFAISFAALSYINPEKNQYSYQLKGFDKDWITVGNITKATYTNLPAGNYTLMVRGSNSDNLWSDEIAKIDIKVLPPWYWTWYMKLMYVALTVAAVFFLVYLYVRHRDRQYKNEIRQIQSDKEIDVYEAKLSFFTMIAHEIRTPVTLIIGPIEKMMRNAASLPAELSKQLNIIDRNSQRLLYLVNQLLDFKKVEESELKVVYRPTDIAELLHNVADRFVPTLEQKGIELVIDILTTPGFTADVDAEALTKMVSNLMNNARKFTHSKIQLTLASNPSEGTFTISVSDDGVGISKENQKKIFTPFFQVAERDGSSQGGTGIGLSIVKRVVEAHGGEIELTSEVGNGTTFTTVLPIRQANVTAEAVPETQAEQVDAIEKTDVEASVRTTMLVVDDNEELCTFIANNFADKYHVITADNGLDALEELRNNDVQLIISDWMMPKMDGVDLCRAVRADMRTSHIPFVLLTAKTDNYSKIEGLNCGADAYVEKPFSIQVLEARIDNLLHMRQLLKSKYSGTPLEPLETVASTPVDNDFLTRLNQIIEANFSNPDLSVDLIADRMDISRSSLYSKIKSLVDVTPNDLIKIARLKAAARLLAEGKYRINEVCYMVGFNSPSYFAKCFAKQFGMNPGDFHP